MLINYEDCSYEVNDREVVSEFISNYTDSDLQEILTGEIVPEEIAEYLECSIEDVPIEVKKLDRRELERAVRDLIGDKNLAYDFKDDAYDEYYEEAHQMTDLEIYGQGEVYEWQK